MNEVFLLLLSLFSTPAHAQCNGLFPSGTACGNATASPAPPTATYITQTGTDARTIGVDCTGTNDSTTAIQTFVNANQSGHLIFPLGCTFFTTSTITVRSTINFVFSSEQLNGAPAGPSLPAQWTWKGTNGGTACATNYASCVKVIDFEYSDHPIVSNMSFLSGTGCPDGTLNFDMDGGSNPNGHITTNGLVDGVYINNGTCANANYLGIAMSKISTANVENFLIQHSQITCSNHYEDKFTVDAVTNSTTMVTSATANFQAGWVGKRISVSISNNRFDTTIASFTNSTTIVLAQAVPFSSSGVTMSVGQPYGIGVYNGNSANDLQQIIWDYNYNNCDAGIYLASGNAQIIAPKSGTSTYGIFIASAVQNNSVDYYASESDHEAVHWWNANNTFALTNSRLTNVLPFATGFVAVGGFPFRFESNQFIVPGSLTPANSVMISPGYRTPPTALTGLAGGSGYVNNTYTNVPLLSANGVYLDTATANITVSGGAVTSVTLISDPGTFYAFRVGDYLSTANSNLGGSGSGFSIQVAAIGYAVGNPGTLVSVANDYSGNGVTNFSKTGLSAFLPNMFSVGDNFGVSSSANAPSGSTILSCTGPAAACSYLEQIPVSGTGAAQYGQEVFTTGATGGNAIAFLATGNETAATTWSGYRAVPMASAFTSQTMFESAPDQAATLTIGSGNLFGFRANTPANVQTPNITNAYGLYVAQQKVTNISNGWGVFQVSGSDVNSFGGFTQFGSASLSGVQGEVGFAKITASASAPGAVGGKIELVCGTNSGTAKLIAYAGTSTTPVTILDNIGSGVGGC